MSPEKLAAFVLKGPARGARLSVLAEQGLGATLQIASWTRKEIMDALEAEAAPGDNVLEALQEACVTHANQIGDTCRFQLIWQDNRGVNVKVIVHTVAPEGANESRAGAGPTEPMSANRIVSELLSALTHKDKAITASMGVVLNAYERALSMQQKTIDLLGNVNRDMRVQLEKQSTAAPRSPEEIQAELDTHNLKQQALTKLLELGPDVLRAGIRQWSAMNGGPEQ